MCIRDRDMCAKKNNNASSRSDVGLKSQRNDSYPLKLKSLRGLKCVNCTSTSVSACPLPSSAQTNSMCDHLYPTEGCFSCWMTKNQRILRTVLTSLAYFLPSISSSFLIAEPARSPKSVGSFVSATELKSCLLYTSRCV